MSLLFPCCPTAIFRSIACIVVLALKSQSVWGLTHVCEKISEIHPSFAHRDSTTSIAVPFSPVGIGASLNHGTPLGISSGVFGAQSVTVNNLCNAVPLYFEASAGFCIPCGQRGSLNGNPGSTIAETEVKPASASTRTSCGRAANYWKHFDCDKSSKSKSNEGYLFRHGIGYFSAVLSGGRSATTDAHCVIFSKSESCGK